MLAPNWPTFLIEISHIPAKPRHRAIVISFNIVGGRSCQEGQPQSTNQYTLDIRKVCLSKTNKKTSILLGICEVYLKEIMHKGYKDTILIYVEQKKKFLKV